MKESIPFQRAKIICTVGPACRDPDVFREMVRAGADGIRVNFSHASHEEAAEVFELAHRCSREFEYPLSIIADLQGPRIRVGNLPDTLEIDEGDRVSLLPEEEFPPASGGGNPPETAIPVTYSELADDVSPGDQILLDDGRITLRVTGVEDSRVAAEALTSGRLASQKGINLPGVVVQAPSMTEKDREDLRFALEHEADYVALSFVRQAEDLRELRSHLEGRSLVMAKIEKDQALVNLEEIMALSDAVMVARGDLGVELPYEDVPHVQKRITRLAHELARPTITATQMLESMTTADIPTRAEVSDVATALFDGTDAVMLSAETAVGEHPVESVRVMARIIERFEEEGPPYPSRMREHPSDERAPVQQTTSGAIAAAAMKAVQRLGSPFLVTFTRSGFTARVVSSQRPPVPILAVTDQPRTFRQLALVWGVCPVLLPEGEEVDYRSMLSEARREALDREFGTDGDYFVVTAGVPFHVTGTTNMIRIEEL